MNKDDLSIEQKVIIMTTRLSIDSNLENKVKKLVSRKDFNWFEFYKLALYHKSAVLCWKNIKRIAPEIKLPNYLNDILYYTYYCTYEKNQLFKNEINEVISNLQQNGIVCIPVKGAYLIPNMYKNPGIRYTADADFLIRHSDVQKLKEILFSCGYIQGEYDYSTEKIRPITRLEHIKWKMVSNVFPFVKLSESKFFPFYQLDFRFAMDDTLSKDSINEIIEQYATDGYVKPAHYLIHLCAHFYNEAKHTATIFDATDMNLIKLCDIREYVLQLMNDNDLAQTILFAENHGLKKQLYYTMFFLEAVYGDGYEREIINKLHIEDDLFLHTFGRTTLYDEATFKKDFWERIFSCNNKDEIAEDTELFNDMK